MKLKFCYEVGEIFFFQTVSTCVCYVIFDMSVMIGWQPKLPTSLVIVVNYTWVQPHKSNYLFILGTLYCNEWICSLACTAYVLWYNLLSGRSIGITSKGCNISTERLWSEEGRTGNGIEGCCGQGTAVWPVYDGQVLHIVSVYQMLTSVLNDHYIFYLFIIYLFIIYFFMYLFCELFCCFLSEVSFSSFPLMTLHVT